MVSFKVLAGQDSDSKDGVLVPPRPVLEFLVKMWRLLVGLKVSGWLLELVDCVFTEQ